jgi:hypothetical protein
MSKTAVAVATLSCLALCLLLAVKPANQLQECVKLSRSTWARWAAAFFVATAYLLHWSADDAFDTADTSSWLV